MSSSSQPESLAGLVLSGQFRLVERLASGGMGTVYSAEQLDANDRRVAVKLLELPKTLTEDEQGRAREGFQREAKAMSLLTHPHTVRLYAYGDDPDTGLLWLAMEMLEGMDLAEFIRLEAPVAPVRAVRIVEQICRSIGDAHGHGIIHRDLKPANVFLCTHEGYPEWVKVLDFGIARILGDDVAATGSGRFSGTPRTMAPEQCRAGGEITPATDFYSLGCVLFEILTGQPPYRAESVAECLSAHMNAPIPRVVAEGLDQDETKAWDHAFMRLLAKRASGRPQSATEMIELLKRALRGEGSSSEVTSTGVPRIEEAASATSPTPSGENGSLKPRARGASRWLWSLWGLAVLAAIFLWEGEPQPLERPEHPDRSGAEAPGDQSEGRARPTKSPKRQSAARTALDSAYTRLELPLPPASCQVQASEVISPLLNALSAIAGAEVGDGHRAALSSLTEDPALVPLKSQPEVVFVRGFVGLTADMAPTEVAGLAGVSEVQCPTWMAPVVLKARALMDSSSAAARARAIPLLERALGSEQLSKSAQADSRVRLARLQEEEPDKVVSITTAVIERYGETDSVGEAYLLRGEARLRLERVALATADLKRAIQLNEGGPFAAHAYLGLARALRTADPEAEVQKFCVRALTLARNAGNAELETRALELCPEKPAWEQAYRGLITAYNTHEADLYFGQFADPMDCFYARPEADVAFLREQRLKHFTDRTGSSQHIEELKVIWSGAAEVGFIEHGQLRNEGRVNDHERGIIMRRIDGSWRVTAEVARAQNVCAPELFNEPAPAPPTKEREPNDGEGQPPPEAPEEPFPSDRPSAPLEETASGSSPVPGPGEPVETSPVQGAPAERGPAGAEPQPTEERPEPSR